MNKNPTIPAHLQTAFEQCRKILEENDVTGVILMHAEQPEGPGVMLQTFKLSASYSVVDWAPGKVLQTLTLPESRIVPNTDPVLIEPKEKTIIKTVNMLANMCMRLAETHKLFKAAELLVRTKFGVVPKDQGNGQAKR